VPLTSFSEFNKAEEGDIWFALGETRPRLLRRHLDQPDFRPEGQGRRDHQRPLRVPDDGAERRGRLRPPECDAGTLTTPEEVEIWMTAPPDLALKLQRPLPEGLAPDRRPRRQEDLARPVVTDEDTGEQGSDVRFAVTSRLTRKLQLITTLSAHAACTLRGRAFRCLATMDRAPRLRPLYYAGGHEPQTELEQCPSELIEILLG
jgi:hypothetical protein